MTAPREPKSSVEEIRARFAGFRQVDVLHKNSCFAAFGAVK